mmetsp:Transcript_27828/g.41250  ORF Transcript_27828/g.41250 Transcript_27828/m.41250 type:complete len:1361 (-) Transcript_27828:174-4256(-)
MRFGSVLYLLATSIVCTNADDAVAKGLEDTIYRAIETGLNGVDIVPVDAVGALVEECFVTSSVTCVVTKTGQDCEDLVIPIEQCRDIDMTFTYKYCSIEEDNDVRIIPGKTTALIETIPVVGLNYNDLRPGRCREFSINRKIDTCKRFYSASLKVEGKRGNDFENGDYCYAWDFIRIFVRRPCEITSKVKSCTVVRTGEDCIDYIAPIDTCDTMEPIEFTFEYCNNEETNLKLRTQKFRALVEMVPVPVEGMELSDLTENECRELTVIRPIDTCKRFYSSSLKVEGWRGDGVGDYCYAYDFERIYTKRPDDPPPTPGSDTPCDVTSSVKCFMAGTKDPCDDIVVPQDECDEETEMTFEFEYCNFEEENSVNLLGGFKTIAKVELLEPMPALDLSIMAPGECRNYRENRKINTCKRFFSASLKVEGRRGDNYGDYCYAYDFYRSYIDRPQTNEDNTGGVTVADDCDVSARITCTIDATGEDCDDIVVPRNQCKEDVDMTFVFEYCSREPTNTIDLKFEKTRARVDTVGLRGLNFDDLQPGECRRLVSTQMVSTCKNFFSAQLKVEGIRNDVGGYCYGWDFYRSYIARSPHNAPTPSGPVGDDEAPCAVSAQVKCTLDSNGQPCKDIVVPLDECDTETPMTFEFEYCNFEESEDIALKDKTRALIETLPVDTLNLNDIPAGRCRRRIETRNINTCKTFFSAQLKVEGLRGGQSGDYCYAFDFLREYIKRVPDGPNEPTPVAEPTPQGPIGACDISAKVKCTVDATGDSCDDIDVGFDDCNEEEPMTFKFKYCNRETESFIALKEDLTTALIDADEVDGLDSSEMDAGSCRTFTEKKKINTCRRFFSASLKVEGLRDGVTNDYCYAWDFLRTYISRPDNSPVPASTECEISAKITCVHDGTGEPCENLVMADNECNTADIVTFDFEICSDEMVNVILREDKTVALIETFAVEDLDKSPLIPGKCRITTEKRRVNTCKRFFSAGLKVEGKRDGYDGYCFAYDHFRTYINRVPTTSPTTVPSFVPSVSVLPTNECEVPTPEERIARITAITLQISGPNVFDDVNSPQRKARDWMIDDDEYDVFCTKTCSKSEFENGGGIFQRYTLAVFYFSTNGDSWNMCGKESEEDCIPRLTNVNSKLDPIRTVSDNELWLSVDMNECLWGGLACNIETMCLDRIEFESNNVNGVIPFEIEQFNGLRFLYIEGAKGPVEYNSGDLAFLQGEIPSLDKLDQLIVIDLNYNQLSGPIPDGVWDMTNLRQLDLNNNFLNGNISADIGNLKQLRFLQLDSNLFTGQLPQDKFGIDFAKDLIVADFKFNDFSGTVPTGLCELFAYQNRLIRLTADCNDLPNGDPRKMECFCCTQCYPIL